MTYQSRERILITGGRGAPALDLARLLHAAGYEVFMAESLKYPLSLASRTIARHFHVPRPNGDPVAYVKALSEIIRTHDVRQLIPVFEESFQIARARAHLPESCRLFLEPIARLGVLHNKWLFQQKAHSFNLSVPETRLVHSHEEALSAIKELGVCVLKPAYSRFAAKVRFENAATLSERKLRELSVSAAEPWLVQRRIFGTEYCTYGFALDGKLKVFCTYRAAFRAGAGAGICFEAVDHPRIFAWVESFVAKFGHTGQISFDFMDSGTEAYALECNPRSTSGIHLFEPEDEIARALTQPETIQVPIQPAKGRMVMASRLAMYLYGLPAVQSVEKAREWLRMLRKGREALSPGDVKKPVRAQLRTLFEIHERARERGVSLLEASTSDIEWNGEI